MRIGGYYIKGISKRFWIILLAFVFLLFMIITMWPKSEDPMAAWMSGEVSMAQALEDGTTAADLEKEFCPERDACINAFSKPASYLESEANLAQPFRLRVFVPDPNIIVPDDTNKALKDRRASLFSTRFSEQGWNFQPAVLLGYDGLDTATFQEGFDTQGLSQTVAEAFVVGSDNQLGSGELVLGLNQPTGVAPGIYDLDGVLYGMSNGLADSTKPETAVGPEFAPYPSPVVLATRISRVSFEEAVNPASQIVNLDISYQVGDIFRLRLDQLEWPGGGKRPRLCMALSNVSNIQQTVWDGFGEMKLSVGGVQETADTTETRFDKSADTYLSPNGAPLTDYLYFGGTDGETDPETFSGSIQSQEVKLLIPPLINGTSSLRDQATIRITPFQPTGQRGMPITDIDKLSTEAKVEPLGASSICSER